ncbi:MAG: ABC transporter transmembrane domain-containing protein, partial [Anaerolineae bacterium]
MTASTATAKSKEWVEARPEKAIRKPDDTGQIVGRLLGYMTGEELRSRFGLALALRFLALLGLSALPALTGQAINVISIPGGSVAELNRWVILAVIAGLLYLGISFIADRMWGDLATRASYKLQVHMFSHMQTLSLTFFDRQGRGELMSRLTNDSEVISLFY